MTHNKLLLNPLCDVFPVMNADEFQNLVADIQANGLLEPGQLDGEGRVLDGRHRYLACNQCRPRVKMLWRRWQGAATVERYTSFVVSQNLHRRHLNAGQRALVASKLITTTHGGNRRSDQDTNSRLEISPENAAKTLNVSATSVLLARRLDATHPELAANVQAGTMTLNAATQIAKRRDAEPTKAALTDANGRTVPDSIGVAWRRANEALGDWKRRVDSVRRDIEAAVEVEDDAATFLHINAVRADLKNAAGQIHAALPHVICVSCGGDGCRDCRQIGWLTRLGYAAAPEGLK